MTTVYLNVHIHNKWRRYYITTNTYVLIKIILITYAFEECIMNMHAVNIIMYDCNCARQFTLFALSMQISI